MWFTRTISIFFGLCFLGGMFLTKHDLDPKTPATGEDVLGGVYLVGFILCVLVLALSFEIPELLDKYRKD